MQLYSISVSNEVLVFNGQPDPRYRFPVFSQMSRTHRVYFTDPATGEEQVFSSKLGHLEVMALAARHFESLTR